MSIYGYDEERQRTWDRKEGREEGENRFATLVSVLIEAGRAANHVTRGIRFVAFFNDVKVGNFVVFFYIFPKVTQI